MEPTGAYLRYEDVPGDEEPIVWLHGLGCAASADFAHVAAHPSLRGHRSLLIDLLGHGYSDAPKDFGYALEDHARTVAALMDHLGLSHSPVFGHSMGGSVAITVAAERPDLVSRLIIAEGNLDPGGGRVSARIAGQSEAEFLASGHQAELDWFLGMGWVTRVATFRAASSHGLYRSAVWLVKGTEPPMRERLYDLSIPRAYLFGAESLPDPDWEELPRHGVLVSSIPDSGHDMPNNNPGGLAETIAAALMA